MNDSCLKSACEQIAQSVSLHNVIIILNQVLAPKSKQAHISNYLTGTVAFPCISALSVDSVLSESGKEESKIPRRQ